METVLRQTTPRQAWQPLSPQFWDAPAAAHLLRRAGFSASPDAVRLALEEGLEATLERCYGETRHFSVPTAMWNKQLEVKHLREQLKGMDKEERRQQYKKINEAGRDAYEAFAYAWFDFARQPPNSPQEKHVLFLESVFVVGYNKVRHAGKLFEHQDTLRRGGYGSYADLARDVSRSPAMIEYLDLQRSDKKRPNENFARELFELFALGEGNYTEADIKEAARAFTGYRVGDAEFNFSEFRFDPHRYDDGVKTVFGKTGRWDGDEVIELVFEQPAASQFHVRELLHQYLAEEPLPTPFVDALAKAWARRDYDQRWLLQTVLGSRLFYAPEFRGNLIKSPAHYYIGLCQDLQLDVFPVSQRLLNQFQNMGQRFQDPPNVRGWVGGKHWITSSTLAARQQLVRNLFYPPPMKSLNADERMRLEEAREDGLGPFFVEDERLEILLRREPSDMVEHLCRHFLANPPDAAFRQTLTEHLDVQPAQRPQRVKETLVALLQSPAYQLA